MNYREARVYLEKLSKYGSVLGLDNMKALLERLGNPQDSLRLIHISGTNGKGSVLAYISTVLQTAGYKTGRYISPTLFSYRERIQVDGIKIEKDALSRNITCIAKAVFEMREKGEGNPTVFEVETALAFMYFKEKKCDVAVIETGLGGALDATNIIKKPLLEIITPISMDHVGILGNTIVDIANQKAGIIKDNTDVITSFQKEPAMNVIKNMCRNKKARLTQVSKNNISEIKYGINNQSFCYGKHKNI